jgi:hypothetical protein
MNTPEIRPNSTDSIENPVTKREIKPFAKTTALANATNTPKLAPIVRFSAAC